MHLSEEIKEKLKNGEPIRALVYARVSTDNDGQKDSCENQVALAMSYINKNPNITLVHEPLIDDGISGTDETKRPEYITMKEIINSSSIDLLIVKQFNRLNRNEANAFMLIDLLEEHNATVLTLLDYKIHDLQDPAERMFLAINFSMDASYSTNVREGQLKYQQQKCERKELDSRNISYGYDWHTEDKSITINEEQAEIIRWVFEEYVYRTGTPASIQKLLKQKGQNLCSRSVSNIIADERYIGNFYINKRTTTGVRQNKKRIKLRKEQWVLVESPDLQIVDRDLFDMAQRVHHTRITFYEKPDNTTTQAHFQGTHLFAGKIFCPICGKPYHFGYADRKKTRPIYTIKSHSECSNSIHRIDEADMTEITRTALKQIIDQQSEVLHSLEYVLIDCVEASQDSGDEIERLKKQKKSRENKIEELIDTLAEGGLTDASKERIKTKINMITDEIDDLTVNIKNKESNKLSFSYVTDKVAEIKSAIAELCNFTTIDRDRIQNYIERIELPPSGDIDMVLKSGQVITIKQQKTMDFSDRDNVSKMGNQDVPYSHLDYTYNKVFLTSFTFIKSTSSKRNPNLKTPVTINCYLRSEEG